MRLRRAGGDTHMGRERSGNSPETGLQRRLTVASLVTVIVLAALAVGVLTVPTTVKAQTTPRELRIGVGQDAIQIITLNPLRLTSNYEFVIVYNAYSTLLTFDKTARLRGDLAYEWKLESDQKTWTFKLVDNAYFANPAAPGDRSHPVTSADVVFTYDMLMSITGDLFDAYVENITAVRAVDDYTVQIELDEPLAIGLPVAATIPILPEYIWGAVRNPLTYRNDQPIGSGPMYYDKANSSIPATFVLRRNPNYYGDVWYCQFSRPDIVRYINYAESAIMVQDFLTGANNLDIIDHISPSEYVGVLADWSPKWAVNVGFVGEISINVITPELRQAYTTYRRGSNNPLLLDQTVRTAIAMSVNKTAIVKDALFGLGEVADSLVPSSHPYYYDIPADDEFVFDTSAARSLLNGAGWRYDSAGNENPAATPLHKQGGTDGLIFRFYTPNTFKEFELAAPMIAGWLAQAGIRTTDRLGNPGFGLYGYNQMVNYWFTADYDIWLWNWIFTPISDISLDVLSVETTAEIGDFSDNYYSNKTFDSLYNQSLRAIDPDERRAITDQMQTMIYDYASYILPFYRHDAYAANPSRPGGWTDFGDWTVNPLLATDSGYAHLYFQVSPQDNPAPRISSIAPVQWFAGGAATISVAASDPEGESLTYVWDFGDGSALQPSTTGTVQHTYADVGTYTVKVRVQDSEWPVCASTTATIFEPGAGNFPPQPTALQASTTLAEPGQNIWFNFTVSDPEGDTLTVTWNFGDGSAQAQDTVTDTQTAKALSRSHPYQADGTYTVRVTITDNQVGIGEHTVVLQATVQIETITPPPPPVGANPLVELGLPILVLAVGLIAVTAIVLRRRKAKKEEEGLREETGQPPAPPPPP